MEEDTTDKNGKVSYSWIIPEDLKEGNYTATFDVSGEGYRRESSSIKFEVTGDTMHLEGVNK